MFLFNELAYQKFMLNFYTFLLLNFSIDTRRDIEYTDKRIVELQILMENFYGKDD